MQNGQQPGCSEWAHEDTGCLFLSHWLMFYSKQPSDANGACVVRGSRSCLSVCARRNDTAPVPDGIRNARLRNLGDTMLIAHTLTAKISGEWFVSAFRINKVKVLTLWRLREIPHLGNLIFLIQFFFSKSVAQKEQSSFFVSTTTFIVTATTTTTTIII